mmetsp:Transcript_60604/g.144411  ORF Transcript_60604/g.144411 Transcript_60604/m.144411 type:complete len:273 (-) Transcript_60604:72-890(-)
MHRLLLRQQCLSCERGPECRLWHGSLAAGGETAGAGAGCVPPIQQIRRSLSGRAADPWRELHGQRQAERHHGLRGAPLRECRLCGIQHGLPPGGQQLPRGGGGGARRGARRQGRGAVHRPARGVLRRGRLADRGVGGVRRGHHRHQHELVGQRGRQRQPGLSLQRQRCGGDLQYHVALPGGRALQSAAQRDALVQRPRADGQCCLPLPGSDDPHLFAGQGHAGVREPHRLGAGGRPRALGSGGRAGRQRPASARGDEFPHGGHGPAEALLRA